MEKEIYEQAQQPSPETPDKPAYIPRPKWQVIGAWIGLILFLVVIAGFYMGIARGGL